MLTGQVIQRYSLMNAWFTKAGVSLANIKVDGKSNEITAVPKLLDKLAIQGCLLTKQDTSIKAGIKNKRKNCGWSEDYLCHVLGLVK